MSRSHPWKWRVSRNKRFVSKGPCAFIYLMIYFSVEKLKLFLDDQHCDWTLWRHSGSLGRTSRCLTYMHKHFFSPEMSVKKALRQDYISNISQHEVVFILQNSAYLLRVKQTIQHRWNSVNERSGLIKNSFRFGKAQGRKTSAHHFTAFSFFYEWVLGVKTVVREWH